MKKLLLSAVVTCLAIFTSCSVSRVGHTGDLTGSIYGIWALDSKAVVPAGSNGNDSRNQVKDVDVDGAQFSYNATKKQIGFTKTLWLTEGLQYEMRLSGTYQVLEMTHSKLVIQKESMGVKTIYSFRRYR